MDKEGQLQLPHLVWTDAHIVLNGAVVLQCWGGEGKEDREEKGKGKDRDNEGSVGKEDRVGGGQRGRRTEGEEDRGGGGQRGRRTEGEEDRGGGQPNQLNNWMYANTSNFSVI